MLAMSRAFPDAVIHTTLYEPESTYPEFAERTVITSRLNRIGPIRRSHRLGLPLLAMAASSMTVDADVVIVSSSGWAHGFGRTGHSARLLLLPRPVDLPDRTPTSAGPRSAR